MAKEYILLNKTKYLWLGLLLFVFPTGSYAFQYKNLDLKFTASAAEMYDDNLLYTKEDQKDDYITTLGLGLSTKYEGKRQSLDLSGRVNYRFNANYKDVKNNSENASVNYQNALSAYRTLGLRYTFIHSHAPESFEEELNRAVGRRESFKHIFNSNYIMNLTERFRVNLKYSYNLTMFSEEDKADTRNHAVGFDTSYLVGGSTTLSMSYNYAKNRLNNVINTINVGMKRDLTRRLHLDGKFGVSFSSTEKDFTLTDNDRSNPYYSISLTSDIDEISSAQLTIHGSDQFTADDDAVSNTWTIQGDYTKQLFEKLGISISVNYGESTSVTDVTNTLAGGDLSLSYGFREDLIANLNYSFSDLGSTDDDVGYIRNAITLNLTKEF